MPIVGSSRWWYRSVLDESRPLSGADPFAGAVASPLALLRRDALNANITAMQEWCDHRNVRLAPHGKTTMAPRLYRRQLTAGAWGITVASPAQARIALMAGAPRILIANEVTDLAGIHWLGMVRRDYPEVGLFCYVDGLEGVTLLENGLAAALPRGARLDVLIELGVPGGRGGARDESAALAVGRALAGSARLRLAGVAGYEGVPGGAADAAGTAAVRQFCRRLRRLAGTLRRRGLIEETPGQPMVLTAGGSIFFDDVVAALTEPPGGPDNLAGPPPEIVLRPGCYVTHDHGLYHRVTPAARGRDGPCLRPALEVWGRVLTRPEATRAIVDVGRRDVSYDQELPHAMWRRPVTGGPASDLNATVVALNDQHAFLDLPGEETLSVGEWVGFGISHPCTTVEKWNVLLLVDDSGRIVETVDTFF